MRAFSTATVTLFLSLLHHAPCINSQSNRIDDVHVSMTANFDSVPLVFEISEFFHDYHTSNKDPNTLYFNYINEFISFYHSDTSSPAASQQDIYQWTLSSFNHQIGVTAMQSLELALSLHYYTPRIAMFEQLYQSYINPDDQRQELIIIQRQNEKAVQINIDNKQTADKVQNAVKNMQSQETDDSMRGVIHWEIFELHDHWIGSDCFDANSRNLLVIYYGDYLSNTFKQLYELLSGNSNAYCFVLRPISLNKSSEEFNLQGYGVELAIKNMEYNVTDDRNIANVAVDVEGNTESIHKQAANTDAIHTETMEFIHSLIDSQNISSLPPLLEMEEEDMKAYMNAIDIQAAKVLLSADQYSMDWIPADSDTKKGEKDINKIKLANNKLLSIFREYSTNFPRYVSATAHIPKETYQYLLPYLQLTQRYQREGQQSFALNGINLATDDFDIFNFYDILHKEAKFVDAMNRITTEYDDKFQNNRLITKLLATPFTIGAAGKANKNSGGGMMGMFGMNAGSDLAEEDVRIDMRDRVFLKQYQKNKDKKSSLKVVTWLNNIEREKRYNNYYTDLKPLKSFMVMQQVVPIKKNMYNGIAVFDPIDFSGYSIFDAMQDGVNQGLPLRLGFILYPKYLLKSTEIRTDTDRQKQFISRRIIQCIVWLLNESKSATFASKQISLFLSNIYTPIMEEMQHKQTQQMEKLMAGMNGADVDAVAQEENEEDINTVPTERMIEEAILDLIVIKKGEKKSKQDVLNEVYAYDIDEYLDITKSFLEDKGITSLLKPDETQQIETSTDNEQFAGCLLALNGRIFPHIMGEFSVYTLMGVLMEEQRNYLMSYATGKISRKTNFNSFVYDQPDVLLRFSKFLSWLSNAGLPTAIITNSEITDKASNISITVLHPQQLETLSDNIPEAVYWDTVYTGNVDQNALNQVSVSTVWLVVNPQSVIGRNVIASFSNIKPLFADYGTANQDSTEADAEAPQTAFGVRFAVLINEESNTIPNTCLALHKDACLNTDGTFSWVKFQDVATKCVATDINDLQLKKGSAQNTGIHQYLTESLGLESGKNYIVLNGEIIPLDHLLKEQDIESTEDVINPLTNHDIWTLITRYNEEIVASMKTLFNEIDGIYNPQINTALNNMIMRVLNVLYWRRLHEGFRTSQSLFSIADHDETLRNAVDSLSLSLFQNDEDGAPFSIRCVLDPLTPQTQRIISFIDELYDYHNLFDIEILLNPVSAMKDDINRYGFPKKLSRYYRYVFNPNNYIAGATNLGKAVFTNMPRDDVLTMGVTDTPGTWLYESLVCKYDLDNLLLSKVEGTQDNILAVNYHLTRMLIQGQCFDEKSKPVPGLQLELRNNTNVFDATIAMQTLGYWQLKANPGVWEMRLREGRTTEVMNIDANQTQSDDALVIPHEDDLKIKVVLNSFTRSPFRIHTKHKPGMEKEELLPQLTEEQIEAEEQHRLKQKQEGTKSTKPESEPDKGSTGSSSIWDTIKTKILGSKGEEEKAETSSTETDAKPTQDTNDNLRTSIFGKKQEKYVSPTPQKRIDAKPDEDTTIHVMSVASGHLYERFLKIMMITTLRNTNAAHVKFWFLKQFLSPRFREFIPHFEKEYNCSIELVEYRWPEWLRKQTVKQRIIWAYKILFLDVLFPLDLERIIFVDADQVVRSDLLELWNLDLQGKPYAYTPFCDSNLETEGFRFWKQGYWSNHLRGKPYHISALYVVDLVTFRRLRAGDSLRVLYEQLSADPNSLANLDQDLPNFAQHMVPIYSLPQEWLWCETWCSMNELDKAKSIDLCNNPLTKEPKMEKAKRMLPEWKKVDDEATEFENKLIAKGFIAV